MFKNLKLNYPPILIDALLNDLSKINIVCGKNNSGKSSLLESIQDKAKRVIGQKLNDEKIDFIFESSADVKQWSGFSIDGRRKRYRDILEEVSKQNNIWYSSEHMLFIDEVATLVLNDPLFSGWKFPDGLVLGALRDLYEDSFKTVLLPPKRNLALKSKIDTNQKPGEDGTEYLIISFTQLISLEGMQVIRFLKRSVKHLAK